ncbi:hypothetical protein D3C73_1507040 [compost metagenome]
MAEAAFMGSRGSRVQRRQIASHEATGSGRRALQQLRIGVQVVKHQLTHDIRRITGEQAQFQPDKGHGQIGSHRATEDAPGIGA